MKKNALIGILIVFNLALLTIAAAPKKPQVLTVSEVDIVDAKGVIRARLAGDLPDAVINGKVVHRGVKAGGLLLYDDTGQERGGYVTYAPGRQVALTLDARDRPGQVVLLAADPDGSSALTMTPDGAGNIVAEVRADTDFGPAFHAKRGKQVVFHAPAVANINDNDMCRELRGALKKMPRDQVLDFCRQRTSEEACQACLGGQ